MNPLLVLLLLLTTPVWALPPDSNAPDWYYPEWLAGAPQAPKFQVRDTVNKYGPYASETKTITLKDLIKFHGHFCGGLIEGATALKVAFDHLSFPTASSTAPTCGSPPTILPVAATRRPISPGPAPASAAMSSIRGSRRATSWCGGSPPVRPCR